MWIISASVELTLYILLMTVLTGWDKILKIGLLHWENTGKTDLSIITLLLYCNMGFKS